MTPVQAYKKQRYEVNGMLKRTKAPIKFRPINIYTHISLTWYGCSSCTFTKILVKSTGMAFAITIFIIRKTTCKMWKQTKKLERTAENVCEMHWTRLCERSKAWNSYLTNSITVKTWNTQTSHINVFRFGSTDYNTGSEVNFFHVNWPNAMAFANTNQVFGGLSTSCILDNCPARVKLRCSISKWTSRREKTFQSR